MRSIKPILVLLLGIVLIAASVSPPAASALTTSGISSGPQGSTQATTLAGPSSTPPVGGNAQGDPGGAGDGLGADLGNKSAGSLDAPVVIPAVELLLQWLKLMQAAG